MAALPYTTAPGTIEKALRGIQAAATPERVTQDFVKTVLQIQGGSGNQMTSFLKKVGFTKPDGTPSEIYKRFRNPATSGSAVAEALKIGYGPLYVRNEYMHQLPDDKLRGLIIQETGQSSESAVAGFILSAIKTFKKFADFSKQGEDEQETALQKTVLEPVVQAADVPTDAIKKRGLGLNLSYTINLNLPATSDAAVFNAIFKSLKENLLRNEHEE
jgi:hypothetical protein